MKLPKRFSKKWGIVSLPLVQTKLVFLTLSFLCFAVPFSGVSQFVTGPIINAALFSAVILSPEKLFLPLIFLPSLGILSRGLIFHPLTPFLVYFFPFIWLGNLALTLVFKKTYQRLGWIIAVLTAAGLKFLILSGAARAFFGFKLAPKFFLTAMGFNQLATALLGGLIAFTFWQKFPHGKNQL